MGVSANDDRLKHLKRAGRLGGIARVNKYGNPGTVEGRRLGGLRSQKKHCSNNDSRFKTLRPITIPLPSVFLSELIGIFMGDGHVGEYQATVCTHVETDIEHAQYTQRIGQQLFNIPVTIVKKRSCKACVVTFSSKEVCRFLASQGLPQGNKVRDGVSVPAWIIENDDFRRFFVRGLFDTDGSVYIDTHTIRGRVYKNVGLTFSNRSMELITRFKSSLEVEGLHPTQRTPFAVFLRREEEIKRYFEIFGSSNPKHQRRLEDFFRFKYPGGVA